MHTKKSQSILILILLGILFFASCDDLITPNSQKLDGVWKCSEVHQEEGTLSYDVTIETDERDSTVIYIYNFMNLENNPSVSSPKNRTV